MEIRRRDAVLVGVTTAVDVTTGTTPAMLESLVERRQVALAWAGVRTISGAAEARPADAVGPAVPAAVRGDGGDQPDGVHVVRLPAPGSSSGSDVVVGTPEQFAARR